MSWPIVSVFVRDEHDVVAARQRARQIAGLLGFDLQEQTRIATAVSEIVRNAYAYASQGRVDFLVEGQSAPQLLTIRVSDRGPGIGDVGLVLSGEYHSPTGMGLGIVGARRLMDRFQIESKRGEGTTVTLGKLLPRRAPLVTPATLGPVADALAREVPAGPLGELRHQNQELLSMLEELRQRQDELARLNAELEDTNRGVVALYAELDEKADHLRRADDMKSRFLSNMSHEFRTPLNSMLALSRILLEQTDGTLSGEQQRQVGYIRRAAEELSDLVNDLLDLAKVEAGKIVVRPAEFEVSGLFGALRGMLRPLLLNESVTLVFDDPEDVPLLYTDEAKVSQILRNFISNALKFTQRGEVRVSAHRAAGGDAVVFSVSDTGIGIKPEDQERVFQEFGQVDNPVQKHVRGTGLGLPLTRKLTRLLGGEVTLHSVFGQGSTFSASIPIRFTPAEAPPEVVTATVEDPRGSAVLVVEDSPQDLLVYERLLRPSRFTMHAVRTLKEARQALERLQPVALVLDIRLLGEDTWGFIGEVKQAAPDLPVIVVSGIDDAAKGLALGADAYAVKPVEREWLLATLDRLTLPVAADLLIIDDDEVSRYIVRSILADTTLMIDEAHGALEGLQRVRAQRPGVILLDLVMPEMSGFEVIERLKADPGTREIPVVVLSSKVLTEAERRRLSPHAVAIVSKGTQGREEPLSELRQALATAGLAVGARA